MKKAYMSNQADFYRYKPKGSSLFIGFWLFFLFGWSSLFGAPSEKSLPFLEVVCKTDQQKPLVLFDWAAHKFVKQNTPKVPKTCLSGLRAWLAKYELDWMSLVGTEQSILDCLAQKGSGCGVWPPGIEYPERSRKTVIRKSARQLQGIIFEVSAVDWKNIQKQGFTILLEDQNGWSLRNRRQLGAGMGLFLRWGEPIGAKPRKWIRIPLRYSKENLFQLDRSVWLALRARLPKLESRGLVWLSREEKL